MFEYEIIAKDLEEKIKNGDYKDGLPSERELSLVYKKSRGTIRRVLELLREKTVIRSRRGSGSYINQAQIEQPLDSIYSLTEDMHKVGKEVKTSILKLEKIIPDEYIKERMKLESDEEVYFIKRLRYIDGEASIIEKNYLPVRLFKKISKPKLVNKSLYKYLEKEHNNHFTESYEEFTAILSDKEIRDDLGLKKSLPIIKINRISYSGVELSEFTEGFVLGDKFLYVVKLK